MIIRDGKRALFCEARSNSWDDARDRLRPAVRPVLAPSFRLRPGTRVFAIGSCFARRIESHLIARGFDVPTLPDRRDDDGPRRAQLLKFTPAAIEQELAWAAAIRARDGRVSVADCEQLACRTPAGLFDVGAGGHFADLAALHRHRQALYDVWRLAFESAVVVITLGLVEAWFDRNLQRYLTFDPPAAEAEGDERFEFRVQEYEDCLRSVQAAIDLIRTARPEARFLLTTSPVPMYRSYRGIDVVLASSEGKSILRAVCGAVERSNEGVDYFPGYEMVVMRRGGDVWQEDARHVAERVVGEVVDALIEHYVIPGTIGTPEPSWAAPSVR